MYWVAVVSLGVAVLLALLLGWAVLALWRAARDMAALQGVLVEMSNALRAAEETARKFGAIVPLLLLALLGGCMHVEGERTGLVVDLAHSKGNPLCANWTAVLQDGAQRVRFSVAEDDVAHQLNFAMYAHMPVIVRYQQAEPFGVYNPCTQGSGFTITRVLQKAQ